METALAAKPADPSTKAGALVTRMARRFGVDPDKMLLTLKQTAFKTEDPVSNEQMMALLVVAEQYGLNPWTGEIFAFPDKRRGIVPVVGVDGWSRIINAHPEFDGVEFVDGPASSDKKYNGAPEWIEAVIFRKDRAHAIRVRERMSECYRPATGPWQSHPARMLRHKSLIQAARLAFGFVGIFDEDEASRIIDVTAQRVPENSPAVEAINEAIIETTPSVAADRSAAASDAPLPHIHTVAGNQVTTFAKLTKLIQDATDPDVLDAHADLIQYLPTDAERADCSTLYRARRAEIAPA